MLQLKLHWANIETVIKHTVHMASTALNSCDKCLHTFSYISDSAVSEKYLCDSKFYRGSRFSSRHWKPSFSTTVIGCPSKDKFQHFHQ